MQNLKELHVPFIDLKRIYKNLKPQFDKAFQDINESGLFLLNDNLNQFEEQFATFCQSKYAIGVNSGLDALVLSLDAAGVKPGDEVLVPAHTYTATWLAVHRVGATPVGVDIDESTFNIDPTLIKPAITPKTKAIIPVHLYGQLCNLPEIHNIAEAHKLVVIEDAAQAHGATYESVNPRVFSHAAAYSFYPGKNLGALGDGGCITTDDQTLTEKLKKLRDYGSSIKYQHDMLGYNSRLSEIQAKILSIKLQNLHKDNDYRRKVSLLYDQGLKDLDSILIPLQPEDPQTHVWHLYVIRTSKRNELQTFLRTRGIETLIHYPVPPHLQDCFTHLNINHGSFPVSEKIAGEILSLPVGPHLLDSQVEHVINSIRVFVKGE